MLVYICGPYRAATIEKRQENIDRARAAMLKLIAAEHSVICTHTMTAHCDNLLPDEAFLKHGLALLEKCDAVYVLKGSRNSVGAMMELGLAKSLGLEIILEAN